MNDEELAAINKAILQRYGMDFGQYEQHSLKRRMSKAMQTFGLENPLVLWQKILQDPAFIYTLIDEITVNLTDLFRDANFWIGLREQILPALAAQPTISIWHAGCSTGQEVYSMAILLEEMGLLHKARIVATDISSQAIATARSAAYPAAEVDQYKRNYLAMGGSQSLSKYYEAEGEQIVFKHLQIPYLRIEQHNLAKDPMSMSFDLIFCRNVMIYFDDALKWQVLRRFHQVLQPNGFLLAGFFDALPEGYEELFELVQPKLKIFRKQ